MQSATRVLGVMIGTPGEASDAGVKAGGVFAALDDAFATVGVVDANLGSLGLYLNAAMAFHPDPTRWRQRFYKNVPGFVARSRRAAAGVRRAPPADVLFQLGVMFDARWDESAPPSVIYTDHTARLSARRPQYGRSPLSATQLERWVELERRAYGRASHVFTRAAFVRESIVDEYGVPADRVTAVGGGVNVLPEAMAAVDRAAAPTALFIGKDFARKGGDVLLRAWPAVRTRVPDARLLLLTRLPDGTSLPPGVALVAPTYEPGAIAQLYASSDAFVLPSRLETWGDVLLEAMAFGLPCVGTDEPPIAEIIQPGVTGTLVPAGEDAPLADSLATLLLDLQRAKAMGAAGRDAVERSYTWPSVVGRMAPVIERVAGR